MELVGLCYSAVNFLAKLHKKSIHPHPGVHMKAAAVGGKRGGKEELEYEVEKEGRWGLEAYVSSDSMDNESWVQLGMSKIQSFFAT